MRKLLLATAYAAWEINSEGTLTTHQMTDGV